MPVRFNSNPTVHHLSNDSGKVAYRKSSKKSALDKLPNCNGRNFPCLYYGLTVDNDKYLTKYKNLKTRNRGFTRADVVEHLKTIGKYKQYIPKEHRLYDLDTGEMYDVSSYRPPPTSRRTATHTGGGKRTNTRRRLK